MDVFLTGQDGFDVFAKLRIVEVVTREWGKESTERQQCFELT